MCRYALRRLSFLSRFLCSDRVLAQSTLVHSVRVLAVVLAAGILAAGMAQAQAINIDETVTIPPPPHQDYNGHLNIGAGQDGTLNILQGGLVTVENDAVLGNSTGVTGTVNVTGPNATSIRFFIPYQKLFVVVGIIGVTTVPGFCPYAEFAAIGGFARNWRCRFRISH